MTQLPDTIVQRHKQQDETIKLDKEGNWYHGEYPILHERTVQFFHRNIARNPQGYYYLTGEDKPVFFEVEDVPFFIKKIEKTIAGFLIYLTDETIELLDLKNLSIGPDNALYCLIKGGEFVAKFFRSTYMEISKFIVPEGRDFVLQFGSKKHPIAKGKLQPQVEFAADRRQKSREGSKKPRVSHKPQKKLAAKPKEAAAVKTKAKPAKKAAKPLKKAAKKAPAKKLKPKQKPKQKSKPKLKAKPKAKKPGKKKK